ncbi:MAG: DUF4465 domain-containing protein [Symploca sp. SIO1C4]|uniref:DUF4465 domain-containing protein n=1 Tax=Symploca sp. SIO1C4 TaxID=2607765 RepID=A0A6B3N279_9CYAN|nr:DUF4465 domain-containing protein [Symploca sp. SIO1C4]
MTKRLSVICLGIALGFLQNNHFEDIMTGTSSFRVVDFEDLTLAPESFNNGSDGAGGFTSQDASFNNSFNSTFQSWSGWSYSNTSDTTTPGFINQYSAFTGTGFGGAGNYGIAFTFNPGDATIELPDGYELDSARITNTTYAALSMLNGDQFAKQFGGPSGNDPDFFLLTITGLDDSNTSVGTVDFYLADYRFADNSQDFIVDDWNLVDLSSLNEATKLSFALTSSDNDPVFGLNTPAYFALDDLILIDSGSNGPLVGTDGNDELDGGAGDDILRGGNGEDTLRGRRGHDRLEGQNGDDILIGNKGDDSLFGEQGDDVLRGGRGDDLLVGGAGIDSLRGGKGDDSLFGEQGDDVLRGGRGDDLLVGGAGIDSLRGGKGDDIFVVAAGAGSDVISDFSDGVDLIGLSGGLSFIDLSFSGNAIVSGAETLATLTGVDTTTLTAADFVSL